MACLTIVLSAVTILQLQATAPKLNQALCHLLRFLLRVRNKADAVAQAIFVNPDLLVKLEQSCPQLTCASRCLLTTLAPGDTELQAPVADPIAAARAAVAA